MRIIAGTWRGRPIAPPPTDDTRPILDRAKTVLFDMLGARLAQPGYLPPVAVLDLFAGTGTLGLEALSRGARFCRFIERHHPTVAVLRKNLDDLGVVREADVVEGDAAAWAIAPPPPAEDGSARYGLVFVDPPYRMLAGPTPMRGIRAVLDRLATHSVIADSAVIVVRYALRAGQPLDLSPLVEEDSRDVGQMTLRFLRRPGIPVPPHDEVSP